MLALAIDKKLQTNTDKNPNIFASQIDIVSSHSI